MLPFAHALPRMRRKVAHDLGLNGMPKTKVLAAIVRLLDTTFIRIGNENTKENDSFGLTTLRRQARQRNGRRHAARCSRARTVWCMTCTWKTNGSGRSLQVSRNGGEDAFAYIDPDGALQSIHSDDVNAYLAESSGEDITAKDFRTWHGTVIAAEYLWHRKPAQTKTRRAARRQKLQHNARRCTREYSSRV